MSHPVSPGSSPLSDSVKNGVAVIVSTYNWPQALELVLRSLDAQSYPPDEIIIADDGSKPETAQLVEHVLRATGRTWCHVRQEDTGFRQARVRNLGARYSRSPYLIFIDHDTVTHRDFVAEHLRYSEPGLLLQGKRAFLPENFTRRVLANPDRPFTPPSPLLPGLGNRKNALHAPWLGRWLMRPKTFQSALRGSNLSVRREDFLRVDGFDETFDGLWGREDSDFCYRLFHAGIRCRNLWFAGLQFHLHHPTSSKRRQRDHLDEELDRVRSERRVWAQRGFSQMDAEGRVIAASADYQQP